MLETVLGHPKNAGKIGRFALMSVLPLVISERLVLNQMKGSDMTKLWLVRNG